MARPTPASALLSLALLLTAGCAEPEPPVESGIPETLARHRARTLSDIRYHVALNVPRQRAAPVEGRTTLRFEWDDPERRPVVVDFKDPAERVRTVSVNGGPATWRPEADHVVLPADQFVPGENVVEIAFAAGDEALNRSDEFLYTLFVPDRAHFSLPVFDQPDLKARVSWQIRVPPGWVAVANGPAATAPSVPSDLAGEGVEAAEGAGEGPRVYEFRESRPIPTYLFAFAAGRFQVEKAERGDFTFTMYHRETDQEAVARNRDAIFDLHHTALEWLEDYTGIDYPFQKFDFVLLPPFQYGGMEHPGAIFYRQSSLMLDASATQGNLLGRASLIAHETAHMWFGDLVTMAWFNDVWTKEVFANFMAAKIVHPSFPEVDHRLRFLLAHHPTAYGVDRTPGANAIRQPLDNLQEAGTLYGAIIYQKAPVVMAHLERTVGEDAFREGMRTYLDRFAYGNARWPDLISILDRSSSEDLVGWSRVWVEEPGRPTVEVGYDPGALDGTVVLSQSDPWELDRIWPQTLELVGSWSGELDSTRVRLESATAVVDAWSGRGAPDWVLPAGAGIEYGLFVLPEAWLDALAGDLANLQVPTHRGAAWIVLQDALLEERIEPEALLDRALTALQEEADELLIARILGIVEGIYWRLLPEEVRVAAAPRVEGVLWEGVERAEANTVKAAFFSAWSDVATTPGAVERMRRIWAREEEVPGVPMSESQEIGLAEGLALRGLPEAEAVLDAQAERIANPDRRARFDFVRPSLSADPSVREAFFRSLADPVNREREPWALAGMSYLQHPLRRAHGATLVRDALELMEEIQATGDIFFPTRWAASTLGSHNEPEVVETVTAYLRAHPDLPPRLRGKVLQPADGVRRAARIVHGAEAAPAWSVQW